jgi:hypothetical protein
MVHFQDFENSLCSGKILGEMVNLQKVNLPKNVNSLKTPTIAFWLFFAQVDFLVS